METIAYTGAVLTGFMISQTYNYFFGGSSSGSDGSVSGTTNINIHTHHHTSPPVNGIGVTKSNANTKSNVNTNANSSVTIPKSLLYDIQVFPNDELKPIQMRSGSGSGSGLSSGLTSSSDLPRLTMEDELIERLKAIRKQVQDDDLH